MEDLIQFRKGLKRDEALEIKAFSRSVLHGRTGAELYAPVGRVFGFLCSGLRAEVNTGVIEP